MVESMVESTVESRAAAWGGMVECMALAIILDGAEEDIGAMEVMAIAVEYFPCL